MALLLEDTFTGAAGSLGAHTADSGATWHSVTLDSSNFPTEAPLAGNITSLRLTGAGGVRGNVTASSRRLGAGYASPEINADDCSIEVLINFDTLSELYIWVDPNATGEAIPVGHFLGVDSGFVYASGDNDAGFVEVENGYSGMHAVKAVWNLGAMFLLVDGVEVASGSYEGTLPSGKLVMVLYNDASGTLAVSELTVEGAEAGIDPFEGEVTGLTPVTIGAPSMPPFQAAVSSLRPVRLGTPVVAADSAPGVKGIRPVRLGYPLMMKFNRPRNRIRMRVFGLAAARLGTPTL